jgi:hypothetical protein
MKLNFPVLTVAVAALLSLNASASIACECRKLDVKTELANAQAVFTGKVAFIGPKESYAVLEVMQSWKGAKAKAVVIQIYDKDENRLAGCNFYPQQDAEYLVFGYGDTVLTTSMCTSKRLLDAEQDVKELNEAVAASANDKDVTPKAEVSQSKLMPKKSAFAYLSKPANPPLTKAEIEKAKGGIVWRKVPLDELSKDEKLDPNWWVAYNAKTGKAERLMNP